LIRKVKFKNLSVRAFINSIF